ncbi:TPA: hypothetical protein DIV49_02370 [Candidatus Saccharibacteria bacterium]|nr:hypothetical protein [Candidatus Saccharibacteria bacterium]HRJ91016.1 hypothetical protein [Candidatus Saccharibacteria bacterium]
MSEMPHAERANTEVFVTIEGPRTGKQFEMRTSTYGVLDPDPESPLSCVSVANSSLSIDIWKGCAWQCSYCHVQGGLQDLDQDTLTMPNRPMKRSPFEINDIIDALENHPFFEPDVSVISIGTASTEPFARGPVSESTFEIMEHFKDKGYKNPFWIVTKAGFPAEYEERLAEITAHGSQVMVSVCWANNPKHIEPVQTNRFRNIDAMKRAGATVGWYLRPLAEGWSTEPEHLTETFRLAAENGAGLDMIVPGGLRWTEGIEYGVEEIRGLEMPDIPHDDNVKELSDETWELIDKLCAEYFPDVPVLRKSSCSLSNMLKLPNHNLVQRKNVDMCQASACPASQREICAGHELPTVEVLQGRLAQVGLGHITVEHIDPETGNVQTQPPLDTMTFALQHITEIQTARNS